VRARRRRILRTHYVVSQTEDFPVARRDSCGMFPPAEHPVGEIFPLIFPIFVVAVNVAVAARRRWRPCLRQRGRRSRAVPSCRAFSNYFGERSPPTPRHAVSLVVGHCRRCSVGVLSTTTNSSPPFPTSSAMSPLDPTRARLHREKGRSRPSVSGRTTHRVGKAACTAERGKQT